MGLSHLKIHPLKLFIDLRVRAIVSQYIISIIVGKGGGSNSTLQNQHRVKLMLQFMEHLEKHLYNAYEGAAVSMPTLPKVRMPSLDNDFNTKTVNGQHIVLRVAFKVK